MMEIGDLPREMLEKVHQWLPPSSLKKAVLVSQQWRKAGEHPVLWEWVKVTVYSQEDIVNLAIRRLQRIQDISINPDNWNTGDWEAFFKGLMKLKYLKKIDRLDWRGNAARDAVDSSLFAKSLAKLEEVDVDGSTFTQIEALFTEMSQDTRIKKIHLTGHNLSRMAPGLFVDVLSKLEDVTLRNNKTTREQMEALFSKILDQSFLKRLDLFEESVSHVGHGLLARALAKVEDVTLEGYYSPSNQIEELINALEFGSEVKKFNLIHYDLSDVDARQFFRAMSRLVEVDLCVCRITDVQTQALFAEILPTTQIKKLDLGWTNLSQLDPGLFSRVMARMENVVFTHDNHLTTAQLEAFFTEAVSSTLLKTMEIRHGNLSTLHHEVLSQAVTRLEEVTLWQARLTQDQVQSMFTAMSRNTQIKNLDITRINMSNVKPQVLATVLNGLDEVTIDRTDITLDQAKAFFSGMSGNTQLKKLRFQDDLSTIESKDLGPALMKVKEVSLGNCNLSTEQVITILTCVLEEDAKLRKLHLAGFDAANVNPEIVGKVQDKLRGELKFGYFNDE